MDQPQPQRRQPVHGPLLRRHGDAGRHHPLGRTRHHPAPGTVRRAGPGTAPTRGGNAPSRPHWLRGCKLRECRFEPTFHKHAGQLCAGIQIHVEDRRLRPRRLPPLAPPGPGLQGPAQAAPRLPAVAGFPLRIRTRPPGHRPDQRRTDPARSGWTTPRPCPATWAPWPARTRPPGGRKRRRCCCTAEIFARAGRASPGPPQASARIAPQAGIGSGSEAGRIYTVFTAWVP
jgi:hypothetical protein